VFEVDKKYEGSDKESSDEDSQEDDDIDYPKHPVSF
jgi:hypothetical protein